MTEENNIYAVMNKILDILHTMPEHGMPAILLGQNEATNYYKEEDIYTYIGKIMKIVLLAINQSSGISNDVEIEQYKHAIKWRDEYLKYIADKLRDEGFDYKNEAVTYGEIIPLMQDLVDHVREIKNIEIAKQKESINSLLNDLNAKDRENGPLKDKIDVLANEVTRLSKCNAVLQEENRGFDEGLGEYRRENGFLKVEKEEISLQFIEIQKQDLELITKLKKIIAFTMQHCDCISRDDETGKYSCATCSRSDDCALPDSGIIVTDDDENIEVKK